MNVTVSSRHVDLTPTMRTYAEEKVEKLAKYFDRIQAVEVVFDAGKEKTTKENSHVKVIVTAVNNHVFVAHDDDEDAYAGIDACVDTMERQLTEYKEKLRNHKT